MTFLSKQRIKVGRSLSGIETCIWRRHTNSWEAYKQPSDDLFYQQIDQGATQIQHKEVAIAIVQAIGTRELPPQTKHLTVEHPRTSKFYMLPKIHKVGNPGRPIVSGCNYPTFAYLDSVMDPLVKKPPTYVKDKNHAL